MSAALAIFRPEAILRLTDAACELALCGVGVWLLVELLRS